MWLCGLLVSGELFLWNRDKDLLKTAAAAPEVVQTITAVQGTCGRLSNPLVTLNLSTRTVTLLSEVSVCIYVTLFSFALFFFLLEPLLHVVENHPSGFMSCLFFNRESRAAVPPGVRGWDARAPGGRHGACVPVGVCGCQGFDRSARRNDQGTMGSHPSS